MNIPLPNWLRAQHPIQQRETARYRRLWLWQVLRWGVLPVLTFVLFVPVLFVALSLAFQIVDSLNSTYAYLDPVLPIILLFLIVFAASAILDLFLALLSLIGGALTIAPERQNQTWESLRLTTLAPAHVINAKIAAVMRQLSPIMLFAFALRVAIVVAGIGLILIPIRLFWADTVSNFNSAVPTTPTSPADWEALSIALLGALSFLVSLVLWVIAPLWRPLYNVLLATLASSFTRSLTSAVGVAFGIQIVVSIIVTAVNQQLGIFGLVLSLTVGVAGTTSDTIGIIFTLLISIVITLVSLLGQIGLALLAGWYTGRRAEQLLN